MGRTTSKRPKPPTEPGGMPPGAFRLLRALRANNSSEWMRAHRDDVQRELYQPFAEILASASRAIGRDGGALEGGADTVFRMQRDLRFSRDKRPYHERIEGVLSPGRRKIGNRSAVHVRCALDGGFLRAGSFLQPPAALKALRSAMVAREARFLAIVRRLESGGIAVTSEAQLSRGPAGFEAHANGPLASYLKLKTPCAERTLARRQWCSSEIHSDIAAFAHGVRPWLLFVTEALADVPDVVARPPRSPERTSRS